MPCASALTVWSRARGSNDCARSSATASSTIEIDSSKGNPHGISGAAHSVVTEHLVDEPGHPTRDAYDRVLAFFRERLAP